MVMAVATTASDKLKRIFAIFAFLLSFFGNFSYIAWPEREALEAAVLRADAKAIIERVRRLPPTKVFEDASRSRRVDTSTS